MLFMNKTKLYKIAGFTIKIAIIILAFGFIFKEVFFKKDIHDIYNFFVRLLNTKNAFTFLLIFAMMFLNWGVESVKWRYLIRSLEKISLRKSLIAVVAGITISSFTPNRIGEYGGRVLVLSPENRWKGVVLTIIGSIAQMLTTIFMGLIAFLLLFKIFAFEKTFETVLIIAAPLSIVILSVFYFKVNLLIKIISKIKFLKRIVKHVSVLNNISKMDLCVVLVLSIFRFFIFSFQFFLLLDICELNLTLYTSFALTSLVFFILAAIPTVALSEFGVRGSISLFIFGLFYATLGLDFNPLKIGVVTAAFLLWLINIAIPTLIGAFLIFKLKLFKH